MARNLSERLQNDEENVIDRRQISRASRKKLAEDTYNGEYQSAINDIFNILTGEQISNYQPPTRTVSGDITLSDSVVTELDGKNLELSITLDTNETTFGANEPSRSWQMRDIEDGTYSFDVTAVEVYEYDTETLTRVNYAVDSVSITIPQTTVTIDTMVDEIGVDVLVDSVSVDSLTIGAKK